MTQHTCPQCSREMTEAGALFCPFCGARLTPETGKETPRGAQALLQKASETVSNRKKLALLRKAREEYPDCLAVEEEWLFQGKLPEKASAVLDFSGIKSHLLHLYLTPEDFSEERQAAMRKELFDDPQLHRCLSLTDAPEAFLSHYLERLCREFIQIFLFGSSEYMPRLLGIPLERNAARALAKPAATVLCGIRADDRLTPAQQGDLTAAFERAYQAECGGDMSWLRQAMDGSEEG